MELPLPKWAGTGGACAAQRVSIGVQAHGGLWGGSAREWHAAFPRSKGLGFRLHCATLQANASRHVKSVRADRTPAWPLDPVAAGVGGRLYRLADQSGLSPLKGGGTEAESRIAFRSDHG